MTEPGLDIRDLWTMDATFAELYDAALAAGEEGAGVMAKPFRLWEEIPEEERWGAGAIDRLIAAAPWDDGLAVTPEARAQQRQYADRELARRLQPNHCAAAVRMQGYVLRLYAPCALRRAASDTLCGVHRGQATHQGIPVPTACPTCGRPFEPGWTWDRSGRPLPPGASQLSQTNLSWEEEQR